MRRLFRLWRIGGQDLRLLVAALRNRDRPQWLMPAALLLVVFALEPLNFAFPLLGVVDDFVLLPLLLHLVLPCRDGRIRPSGPNASSVLNAADDFFDARLRALDS